MPAPHSCITPSPSSPHPPQTLSLISFSTSPLLSPKKKIPKKITQKKKNLHFFLLLQLFSHRNLAQKKLKRNSANARREELEKHLDRLNEEACVVD
jgi:hypothetical protein